MATPSIMANSCLMDQYFCMSCAKSFPLCSQPYMIYTMRSCKCASWFVAFCMSCMDVHTGRFINVLIVLTFMLRLYISVFVFLNGCDGITSLQYIAQTLVYIVCVHCIGVCIKLCTTGIVLVSPHFLPIIITNGLWSVM